LITTRQLNGKNPVRRGGERKDCYQTMVSIVTFMVLCTHRR
jgi:hypothetical protein